MDLDYRAKNQAGNGRVIITPGKLVEYKKSVHNNINFIITLETFSSQKYMGFFI